MAQESKVSAAIDATQLAAIKEKLAGLRTDLAGVLTINLTGKDRKEILKMGDKTLAFVEKALEFANQNPWLLPGYINLDEANKDFALAKALSDIQKECTPMVRGMEDTKMVAGSEAYNAMLLFYGFLKEANRSNQAGVQAICDELQKRFPGRSSRSATK